MKKLFLLLGIYIIILTGCSSQNYEAEEIVDSESMPETEEQTSISDISPEYKLIGQDYHSVISQFRDNGCIIFDDAYGVASQRLSEWLSNISMFDKTITNYPLSVQVAYGKENNSFLWCVMFIDNDVVIAYHLLTDGKTSIGEYIGGSEFYEINNLQSDPQIKQLLGTNDGQPWDDNFSVRPVYTENDCIAQFNAMKLNWKTGDLTSDIAKMAFMDVYVEAICETDQDSLGNNDLMESISSDSLQDEAESSTPSEQPVYTDTPLAPSEDHTLAAQQEPVLSKEETAQIMLDEAGVLPEFRFDTYTPQVIITGYMKDAMFFVPDEKIALKGYWEADRWNVLDTLYVHEKYHLESGKRYKLKGVLRYDELQQVEIIEEY